MIGIVEVNPSVQAVLNSYPVEAREYLLEIRGLVLSLAQQEDIEGLTETLKWGEPSFTSKRGSTLRMAWKPNTPNSASLFFNCNSRLVETFRALNTGKLNFIGKRELRLNFSEPLPTVELRSCISMTLRYHDIKHLPLLGA